MAYFTCPNCNKELNDDLIIRTDAFEGEYGDLYGTVECKLCGAHLAVYPRTAYDVHIIHRQENK